MAEHVIQIALNKGNTPMDLSAPTPSERSPIPNPNPSVNSNQNQSAVSVTIAGCGGAGLNLSRIFKNSPKPTNVLYFDTSMTNSRAGESVFIIGSGSGSGSHRAENARDIDRQLPQMTDEELGLADVAIVMFSLSGGSGSVLAPVMIREYARRGVRVIGVCIADTSYAVGAKNTLNTLKTLTAIAKNNDLYLPLIVLSNDHAKTRGVVDQAAKELVSDLIDLLTSSVYEVDRNDRLNWINPTKVIDTKPGIKLMTFASEGLKDYGDIVLGTSSNEMIDALLILQSSPEEGGNDRFQPSRLKKTGFFNQPSRRLVGKVSSDISSIESIIDHVERMQKIDAGEKHQTIDRLHTSGDDLIL